MFVISFNDNRDFFLEELICNSDLEFNKLFKLNMSPNHRIFTRYPLNRKRQLNLYVKRFNNDKLKKNHAARKRLK